MVRALIFDPHLQDRITQIHKIEPLPPPHPDLVFPLLETSAVEPHSDYRFRPRLRQRIHQGGYPGRHRMLPKPAEELQLLSHQMIQDRHLLLDSGPVTVATPTVGPGKDILHRLNRRYGAPS